MVDIKFGTDGWRAIIDKEYTVDNVARIATGTALWLKKKYNTPVAVVGYDTRYKSELFAEITAKMLCKNGINVLFANGFVSTPMVCKGILSYTANIGIIITASHNPSEYNGYKLKGDFGGPLFPEYLSEVESLIPDSVTIPDDSIEDLVKQFKLKLIDLETIYCNALEENFDLKSIHESGIILGYDAMYGAGQNVIRRLFPDAQLLHCTLNPSFDGTPPEPIHKNLTEFSEMVKSSDIGFGLATDGDADRIGIYDKDGNFIDSHHMILLMIHYLHKYKKLNGKVVVAFSTSQKIKKLCNAYNIPYEVTKIGFKYIGSKMVEQDILLGGEESGGIAIKGHLPERDGIWSGLALLEFMAKTGKTIKELIDEVYAVVGSFAYNRYDLHLDNITKKQILEKCKIGQYKKFGKYKVESVENIDGYKYFFANDIALMIRPSGTEPVLRIYAEAPDIETVTEILDIVSSTLAV